MERIITIIDDNGVRVSEGPDSEKVISGLALIKKENRFFQEVERKRGQHVYNSRKN